MLHESTLKDSRRQEGTFLCKFMTSLRNLVSESGQFIFFPCRRRGFHYYGLRDVKQCVLLPTLWVAVTDRDLLGIQGHHLHT